MVLLAIEIEFSICKLQDLANCNMRSEFFFLSKTDDEISLVCPTVDVPKNVLVRDDGWKALKIDGMLDFSLIGILSRITTVLANSKIGVFAVSTYNTDYILVKKDNFKSAVTALKDAGYIVKSY